MRVNFRALTASVLVVLALVILLAYGMYTSATAQDTQCTLTHVSETKPPKNIKTAQDYYDNGNYYYDIGKCKLAVANYTKAISLNGNFYQALNNRAYTNMRMRNYKDALPDLDKAIQLNPDYVQALMNRGDIHNYYYAIDRQAAIADYERVIAITGPQGGTTSVCGHLFLAKHNGWNLGTFIGLLTGQAELCR